MGHLAPQPLLAGAGLAPLPRGAYCGRRAQGWCPFILVQYAGSQPEAPAIFVEGVNPGTYIFVLIGYVGSGPPCPEPYPLISSKDAHKIVFFF